MAPISAVSKRRTGRRSQFVVPDLTSTELARPSLLPSEPSPLATSATIQLIDTQAAEEMAACVSGVRSVNRSASGISREHLRTNQKGGSARVAKDRPPICRSTTALRDLSASRPPRYAGLRRSAVRSQSWDSTSRLDAMMSATSSFQPSGECNVNTTTSPDLARA
jgi:hypothetical protein